MCLFHLCMPECSTGKCIYEYILSFSIVDQLSELNENCLVEALVILDTAAGFGIMFHLSALWRCSGLIHKLRKKPRLRDYADLCKYWL